MEKIFIQHFDKFIISYYVLFCFVSFFNTLNSSIKNEIGKNISDSLYLITNNSLM